MLVEPEADPETGLAIDTGSDAGMFAETAAQLAFEQPVKTTVGHGFDAVFRFGREKPDAFARGEFGKQAEAFFRGGGEKRGADQVDRRGGQLGAFTGARLGINVAEETEPGRGGEQDEQGEQQEGARQQRAGRHASRAAPSGTKT